MDPRAFSEVTWAILISKSTLRAMPKKAYLDPLGTIDIALEATGSRNISHTGCFFIAADIEKDRKKALNDRQRESGPNRQKIKCASCVKCTAQGFETTTKGDDWEMAAGELSVSENKDSQYTTIPSKNILKQHMSTSRQERERETGSFHQELRHYARHFHLQQEYFLCPSAVSTEPLIDVESVLRCIPGSKDTSQSNQRPALLSTRQSTVWPWIWGL